MDNRALEHRTAVGNQHCRFAGADRLSRNARLAARFPASVALKLQGLNNTFVGGLLMLTALNSVMANPASGQRHDGPTRRGSAPPDAGARPALAPGTSASQGYSPVAADVQCPVITRIQNVANAAAAACVVRPRTCAVAAGTVLAAGIVGTAVLTAQQMLGGDTRERGGALPGTLPDAAPQAAQTDALAALVARTRLLATARLHVSAGQQWKDLQTALLDIARDCQDDPACQRTRILQLLQELPSEERDQLQAVLIPEEARSALLPGASAYPLPPAPVDDLLAYLADVLANMYTLDVANYQDALERVVKVTRHRASSSLTAPSGEAGANARRQDAIARLFEEAGLDVHREPLPLMDGQRRPGQYQPHNLHIRSPCTPTAPDRRLLLVAHGDMAGLSEGSEGALDNASGVALVLHLMRKLQNMPLPSGVQVDALITAQEEAGLKGSRHHVQQCLATGNCPTLTLNMDMVGRGTHSYVMSGSDAFAEHPSVGTAPYFHSAIRGRAYEREAMQLFQQVMAAHGFVQLLQNDSFLLASDQIPFQNASLPAIGVAQLSFAEAEAMLARQVKRYQWLRASMEVDWELRDNVMSGRVVLPADQKEALREKSRAVEQAYDALIALIAKQDKESVAMMHSGLDRLHRVDSRSAVAFGKALLAYIQQWMAQGAE